MKGIGFYDEDFFTIKRDKALYAESIRRLLLTNPGERPGQPYFGVGLKHMLFELADDLSVDTIKEKINEQTEIYLPMLTITQILTSLKENSLLLKVGFLEKGEMPEDERFLELEFFGVEEA